MTSISSSSTISKSPSIQSCANCHQASEKLQNCAQCHFEKYCGAECQKMHWKTTHKAVCLTWKPIVELANNWLPSNHSFIHEPAEVPRILRDQFPNEMQGTVAVDLGAGIGESTIYLLKKGWKVVAVDSDCNSIDILRRRIEAINSLWISTKQLIIIQTTIEAFTFPEKPSLIVVNNVFPYMNPSAMVRLWKNIHKNLLPEGNLIGNFFLDEETFGCLKLKSQGAWTIKEEETIKKILTSESLYTIQLYRRRPKAYKSCSMEFHLKKAEQEIESESSNLNLIIETFKEILSFELD